MPVGGTFHHDSKSIINCTKHVALDLVQASTVQCLWKSPEQHAVSQHLSLSTPVTSNTQILRPKHIDWSHYSRIWLVVLNSLKNDSPLPASIPLIKEIAWMILADPSTVRAPSSAQEYLAQTSFAMYATKATVRHIDHTLLGPIATPAWKSAQGTTHCGTCQRCLSAVMQH